MDQTPNQQIPVEASSAQDVDDQLEIVSCSAQEIEEETKNNQYNDLAQMEPLIEYPPSEGRSSISEPADTAKHFLFPPLKSDDETTSEIAFADELPQQVDQFEEFVEITQLVEFSELLEVYELQAGNLPVEYCDDETSISNNGESSTHDDTNTVAVGDESSVAVGDLLGLDEVDEDGTSLKVYALDRGENEVSIDSNINKDHQKTSVENYETREDKSSAEESMTHDSPYLVICETVSQSDSESTASSASQGYYLCSNGNRKIHEGSEDGSERLVKTTRKPYLVVPKRRQGPPPYKPSSDVVIGAVKFTPTATHCDSWDELGSSEWLSECGKAEWYPLDVQSVKLCDPENMSETGSTSTLIADTEEPRAAENGESPLTLNTSGSITSENPEQANDGESVTSTCSWKKITDSQVLQKLRIINAFKPMKVKRRNVQRWHPAPPLSPDECATVVSRARAMSLTNIMQKAKELQSDDTIESTHFSPSNRNVAKLNGAKISPWTNQQAKNQQTKASHPKFTRKESIIEQEIRLQKEREKELSLEREMIAKAKLTSPTDEQKGEKPLKNTKAAPQPVEDGLPSPVINSKSSTPKNKTKSLFQLQGSVSSPKEDAADSKLPSPWYSSESPIARDIRTTHEREEELKTARRQSCQPLPTGKP